MCCVYCKSHRCFTYLQQRVEDISNVSRKVVGGYLKYVDYLDIIYKYNHILQYEMNALNSNLP